MGIEQGLVASAFTAIEGEDLIALAERPPRRKRMGWFTKAVAMLAAAYGMQAPALNGYKDAQSARLQLQTEPPIPKTVLLNGVTMYGT